MLNIEQRKLPYPIGMSSTYTGQDGNEPERHAIFRVINPEKPLMHFRWRITSEHKHVLSKRALENSHTKMPTNKFNTHPLTHEGQTNKSLQTKTEIYETR